MCPDPGRLGAPGRDSTAGLSQVQSRRELPNWTGAATILAAVALFFVRGPADQAESLGSQLFAPIQGGITDLAGQVQTFTQNLHRVAEIADQNEAYRQEIDRLQSELVRLRELELENEVLRRLLGLKYQARQGELLPVRVIASDISPLVQGITVDRGANDGVRTDMAVVTWKGLVGRVVRVNPTTSKVLLLTDVNNSVSVRVQDPDSRATGVVRGRADGTLLLEYVPQQERLAEGQLVITSGLGGIYPAGLQVGRIAQVMQNDYDVFQRATVVPAAEMHKLEHLYILLGSAAEQRE